MKNGTDSGAHGQNGQIEFNGSQYELTRADIRLIADALDIVNPDSEPAIKRALKLKRIFAQLSGSKHPKLAKKAKRPEIIITVDGGVVQDVRRIPTHTKVDVTAFDYDVDGADEGGMTKDAMGNECFITEW